MGEPETGRAFYLDAAEQARALDKPEVLATALLHLAYEECRSGTTDIEPHLISALELAGKSEKPYIRAIARRIIDRVNALKSERQDTAK
jgi:hypothetical protein